MLLKLYNKNNNPADLQRVIDLLNDGGLLIYPTDTCYAIGCHGLKERAIERICQLKGIDPRKHNLSIGVPTYVRKQSSKLSYTE